MEIWKPVPGYEGFYDASECGHVRSVSRPSTHYTGKMIMRGGRVLRGCINFKGYLQVSLCRDGKTRTAFVHALVALTYRGPRPSGLLVRHLNGDATDNRASNLAYGTQLENVADMEVHGTIRRGENHALAKLTAENVRLMRDLAPTHRRQALADMFNVSINQVDNVVNNRQWKCLL